LLCDMEELFLKILNLVSDLGYLGIFIMTLIEGTLIPIPNEITLIPAGFLVVQGKFTFWILLLVAALGNVLGSMLSYYIALRYGRSLLLRYGKYMFFDENKLKKMEAFFSKHGAFSVFIGRITPGLKHFISFPAGLAKMKLWFFAFYSISGGTIWVLFLIFLGMILGHNKERLYQYMDNINIVIISIISLTVIFYVWRNKRRKTEIRENKE